MDDISLKYSTEKRQADTQLAQHKPMDEEIINKQLMTAGKSTDVKHLRRELSHDIRMKFEDRQE